MRTLILFPLLVAACSAPAEQEPKPRTVDANSPVGLYQRAGVPNRPSRICIAGQGTDLRFGLNSSYEGPESCTAKGRVRQDGPTLNLIIDGEPACAMSATLTENGLMLNQPQGTECSYYCGANTELDEGSFDRVGSTDTDAHKAVDLVGEALC